MVRSVGGEHDVLRGHLLVGDAYYRLERFPDALREYQAALALDPGNTSIKRRRDLVEQAAPRSQLRAQDP